MNMKNLFLRIALAVGVLVASPAGAVNLRWQISVANDAVNLSPTTGAVLVYSVQQALKQCGWTVVQWSDGTTLTTSSAGWSSGAAGAGNAANNSAWLRMTDPAGVREFVVQRSTTNLLWRMKWSHSAKFSGGTPNATTPPTATDQQHVAGTDVPAFLAWLPTENTYRAHIVCDADPPYSFAVIVLPNGGGVARSLWYLNMASGSYPSADVAPYVVDMRSGDTVVGSLDGVTANTDGLGAGWHKKGLVGEAWVQYAAQSLTDNSQAAAPGGYGANPYSGDDQIFPIPVGRRSSLGNGGWKGWLPTALLGWTGSARADGDYFDTLGGSRYAVFGDLAIRFPSSVVPSL
jgi:hypothetical protein